MKTSDRHLCTTIWKGKLYAFTCMTFGLRDAPGEFQRRTEYVAGAIKRDLRIPVSEVYLDDFVQVCTDAEYDEVIATISNFGFVTGKKKCARPSTLQEVLGLEINTKDMIIRAPDNKIEAVTKMLAEFWTKEKSSTSSLARTLGMLVAIEPAVPHAMLLSRPMYDDLKDELVKCGRANSLSDITLDRHGNSDTTGATYKWLDTPLVPSKSGREAARLVAGLLGSHNGQSIKAKNAKVIVRTDASEKGIGGRAFIVGENGTATAVIEVTGAMPKEMLESSSTAREAYAFAYVCSRVPHELLKGSDIIGVVDNKGLTKRFWSGSKNALVNFSLTDLATFLLRIDAKVQRMLWTPRTNMEAEDGLSRRDEFADARLEVSRIWFESWSATAAPRPTIDAFASCDDAKLPRYASVDGTSGFMDGTSLPWSEEEVLWAFPPLSIVARSLRNWIRSPSRVAYWCLADVAWGQWHAILQRPDLASKTVARRVPVDGAMSSWKFVVIRVDK